MSENISYKCINCQLIVTFPASSPPRCKNCDGKIFDQLRSKRGPPISTSTKNEK